MYDQTDRETASVSFHETHPVVKIKVIIVLHTTRYMYANTPELIKLHIAIHDNITMKTKQLELQASQFLTCPISSQI